MNQIRVIKPKRMLYLFNALLSLTVLASCDKENQIDPVSTTIKDTVSTTIDSIEVKYQASFDVEVEQDIIYAKGLSHKTLNSSLTSTLDLKLDIYKPKNSTTKRPCMVLIHGGGFEKGDKSGSDIVDQANYFSSRGWVVFSINYRLMADNGTVPIEWVQYGQNSLPSVIIPQFHAMYPAHRDAKAALRWVVANASKYNIDVNYITVGGSSAGAIVANTLGITDSEDYTNEISVNTDPTLTTTNLGQTYSIKTILDYWGSDAGVDAMFEVYGRLRIDSTDAPILIAHGTVDKTVEFSYAEELRDTYLKTAVPYLFYPLVGLGHGVWDATVDGKDLKMLGFDFIVKQQKMKVK